MCPRCKGCLGRGWCLDTKSEYDYCLNCGHRMNQAMYYQHSVERDEIPRRCLDCNRKHREVYEKKTGEQRIYTRCYVCRRKQQSQRRRVKVNG